MNESLFSPQWYRVADLHPALRSHVKLHRQVIHEKVWYLLEDSVSGRQHRLDAIAYSFIGQLDGRFTVDELWQQLLDELKDDAPSQYDIVRLVGQLHQADLVQCEMTPDVEELFSRQERRRNKRRLGMVNPLAFRTPLLNPSKALNRLYPWTRFLFSKAMFFLMVGIIAMAAFAGIQHLDELALQAKLQLPSPQYWLMLWLVFPVMKIIHEFSHALAVKHWGGVVHEMGITLMLLMPVPYVDASAANLFAQKHARIMVSAAGIFAEALLAALALLVWFNVEEGLLREVAFVVIMIGTLSTLLFNGNPLVKFDGYHVLADAIEIPNLAFQSRRFWINLWKTRLLGLETQALGNTDRERKWLLAYAPASWVYRFTLMVTIGTWLLDISATLALAVVALFAWSLFLKPAYQIVSFFLSSPELNRKRFTHWGRTSIVIAAIFAVLVIFPAPYTSIAEGVVWISDDARVRTSTEGFVDEVLVNDGDKVRKGQMLARLSNPALQTEKLTVEARLRALRIEYQNELRNNIAKSSGLKKEIEIVEKKIEKLSSDIEDLVVTAPVSGTLYIDQPEDLKGELIKKGEEIAYVFPDSGMRVRAVVEQQDIAAVREQTKQVQVQLATAKDETLDAEITSAELTPTMILPSPALGLAGGGRILTNPEDGNHLETLHSIFVVDLTVANVQPSTYGERVWVRFNHGTAPLMQQWAQSLQQLFLKHVAAAA